MCGHSSYYILHLTASALPNLKVTDMGYQFVANSFITLSLNSAPHQFHSERVRKNIIVLCRVVIGVYY